MCYVDESAHHALFELYVTDLENVTAVSLNRRPKAHEDIGATTL